MQVAHSWSVCRLPEMEAEARNMALLQLLQGPLLVQLLQARSPESSCLQPFLLLEPDRISTFVLLEKQAESWEHAAVGFLPLSRPSHRAAL